MALIVVAMHLLMLAGSGATAQTCNIGNFSKDYGSFGKPIAIVKATSAGTCCSFCVRHTGCGHFTFVPPALHEDGYLMEAEGHCKLKKGAASLVPSKGAITGQPPLSPSPSPPPVPVPPPPGPPSPGPLPGPLLGFQPHIIYMLADDLGHYNMGWRGNKEARTPNMDALVAEGIVLDRMYVYKYCSPTRSALLSGRYPIHVNEANRGPSAAGGVDLRMTIVAEKMKEAGYATHQVGKWNAGSLAWGQMPIEKGFDSSYGYMSGEEDHYTQIGGYMEGIVDLWENNQPAYGKNGTYNAFRFEERAVDIITKHDTSQPLFMYLAWQNAHTPNQVPSEFLGPELHDDRDEGSYKLRRTYEAMVHCLDNGIGNVTNALKTKGMWDKTLVIFSSDNGGREDSSFGGNNFPLRGMKFSDFEGGVRVASFASGGVVPRNRRGVTETGLIHVCDWYATFCALGGADPWDKKAADAQLPPVDGMNMWPVLGSGIPSPRKIIPLSHQAIIAWPYKLVMGDQGGKGWWTSATHPNRTQPKNNDKGCGNRGCLFDIRADPEEYNDIGASSTEVLQNLSSLLDAYVATKFQTDSIPGYDDCITISKYVASHQGFGGPLCSKSKATIVV